ncbi:MAG: thioredoxin [Saprospiraceae bacterium]
MAKKVSFKELINGEKPVLVDFTASWCGPCKMMAPVVEKVKRDIGSKATIVKIDIDNNAQFATSMGITGVPTFVLFKNGKELWRRVGVVSGTQLQNVLEQHAA